MATKTINVCDVTGTTHKVEETQVIVQTVKADTAQVIPLRAISVDLCPSALARLNRFIDRGTSPPPPKRSSQEESPTEETSKDE